MPHLLPAFPLTANVWRFDRWADSLLPDYEYPAELVMRHHPTRYVNSAGGLEIVHLVEIWFPTGSDVRGTYEVFDGELPDMIECPAGSGELWAADFVNYHARGLPNEFLVAFARHTTLKHGPFPHV